MKTLVTTLLFLLSLSTAYADGGSIIPGSCPLNGSEVNEIRYALSDHSLQNQGPQGQSVPNQSIDAQSFAQQSIPNQSFESQGAEAHSALDLDSDSPGSEIELGILTADYHFTGASRAHTLRRHWNGVHYPGESIPSLFNHNVFPGFFVVESLIFETINNAIALNIPPCSTRNVNGRPYAAYTLAITGGTIVRVVINTAAHVIVTAYPLH